MEASWGPSTGLADAGTASRLDTCIPGTVICTLRQVHAAQQLSDWQAAQTANSAALGCKFAPGISYIAKYVPDIYCSASSMSNWMSRQLSVH